MSKLQLPSDHEYVKGRTCTTCDTFKPASEYTIERDSRALTGVAMRSKCRPCNELIKYKSFIKRRYGITWDTYVSMLDEQEGCCKICKTTSSNTTRTDRLVVDHCHDTGEVRGLLCAKCNMAIGLLDDDPEKIQAALNYIR